MSESPATAAESATGALRKLVEAIQVGDDGGGKDADANTMLRLVGSELLPIAVHARELEVRETKIRAERLKIESSREIWEDNRNFWKKARESWELQRTAMKKIEELLRPDADKSMKQLVEERALAQERAEVREVLKTMKQLPQKIAEREEVVNLTSETTTIADREEERNKVRRGGGVLSLRFVCSLHECFL